MQFERKFTAGRLGPDTNVVGWKPEEVKLFDPRVGPFGVAHDALEHPERIDATFANELMAHGATLYTRPESDRRIVAENLSGLYAGLRQGLFPAAPQVDWWPAGSLADVLTAQVGVDHVLSPVECATLRSWLMRGYVNTRVRYAMIGQAATRAMFAGVSAKVELLQPRVGDKLSVWYEGLNWGVDLSA